VDRFVAVAFKPLPRAEWEQVVAHLLQQGGLPDQQADELSKLLVGFHVCVQAAIEGTNGSTTAFPEVRFVPTSLQARSPHQAMNVSYQLSMDSRCMGPLGVLHHHHPHSRP